MRLRPATLNDARCLLTWRNDPDTRQMFFSTAEVPWGAHFAWLTRVLADDAQKLLIWETDEGIPVGTIRVGPDQGAGRDLSWTIAPDWRGNGLGTEMLRTLVTTHPDRYRARIKPDNLASLAVCLKAGFRHAAQDDDSVTFHCDSRQFGTPAP